MPATRTKKGRSVAIPTDPGARDRKLVEQVVSERAEQNLNHWYAFVLRYQRLSPDYRLDLAMQIQTQGEQQ
jgi:hypothetical protein